MKKILITGATGWIGKSLIYHIKKNYNNEFDIIDQLLKNNVPYNKFITLDAEMDIPAGIYNLSVVSNSLVNLNISGRDYKINTTTPQHIVFHKNKKTLEIQIQLNWQRIL